MTEFIPAEKGVPIRQPSTANLMVDSGNRPNPNNTYANEFTISPPNSILNGFFTRIGVSEVAFEWNEYNVTSDTSGAIIDVSGVGPTTITIQPGIYTVEKYIDAFLEQIRDISGTLGTEILSQIDPPALYASNPAVYWYLLVGLPVNSLNNNTYVLPGKKLYLDGVADLRVYRYIDFVSPQLTYNQDLKDASTKGNTARDVLARWYMEYDNPVQLDAYNYPIQMGYTAFQLRRLFSPPKQIKWTPNQPIGQISFKLYKNTLFPFDAVTFNSSVNNIIVIVQKVC